MHKVIAGDTFELISRKAYGVETEALNIAKANPGASEPLSVGTTLIIPVLPDAPETAPAEFAANNANEVALLIDGERFRFWDQIKITRSIDSMSTVSFSAPFTADAQSFREAFKPLSFKLVQVTVGGIPLFTGTMVGVTPVLEKDKKTIEVSCYATPGVLNDCTPPASAFPLEFLDQDLKAIAKTLAAPFGLAVEFLVDPGPIFERVALDPGKKILAFLSELAKQRNLIISDSPSGKLVFLQSTADTAPVAVLSQGASPLLSVTPFFEPQDYHSHVTGIEPALIGGLAGAQFTVKNRHLPGVVRPLTFKAPDTLDADVKAAVDAKIGRMFGNAVSYAVLVSTWRDSNGKLWEPNTLINVTAPDAMIYNEYIFLIRSVVFDKDRATGTAVLTIVLPGAFSGRIPERMPWDD